MLLYKMIVNIERIMLILILNMTKMIKIAFSNYMFQTKNQSSI